MQYVDEVEIEQVDLNVYYKNGHYQSQYYEDAHDGYAYEREDYRLARFDLEGSENKVIIKQDVQGGYKGSLKTYKLHLIGLPYDCSKVEVDGIEVNIENNEVVVKADFSTLEIS